MPADFSGKWKPIANEGVDEYFKKLGMGSVKVNAAKEGTQTVTQTGEHLKVVTTATVVIKFTKTSEYTVGEEFEDKDPADNIWKCMPNWDGESILIQAECTKKNFKQTIVRKLEGDEMVMTFDLTAPDGTLSCTRRFKKKE